MWSLLIQYVVGSIVVALLLSSQKQKAASLDDFDLPEIEDGSPVYYLAGRAKIKSPNLIWYGALSTKAIKTSGLFAQKTGQYKYYLGMQLAIALGGGMTLRKIWFGKDDPVWKGDNGPSSFFIEDMSAFGGKTSGGGYSLFIDFYDGSTTQTRNSYLQSKITGIVPVLRGMSYLVVRGYIGNAPQLKPFAVEVQRIPDPLELGTKATIGTEGDCNPANVLYELLSNNFGAGSVPTQKLNYASFLSAGNLFYDEDEGITVLAGGSAGQISATIQDILAQVDANLYEEPTTGEIHLMPIRQDYDTDSLPILDASCITVMDNYSTNLWGDTKNKVRVKFDDRSKQYEERVAVAEDISNIAFQDGQIKSVNVDRKYIKRAVQANKVAARELVVYSTQLTNARCAVTRKFQGVRPGDVLKLTYPKYNVQELIMRVGKVNLGDPGNDQVTLDMVADKFSLSDAIYAPTPESDFSTPVTGATSVLKARVIEAPRWFSAVQSDVLDPDAPRAIALPVQPAGTQLSYTLYAKTASESTYDEVDQEVPFAAYGVMSASYPQSYDYDTTTGIVLSYMDDHDVLQAVAQTQIANGQNLILIGDEIIAYETFEVDESVVTLKGIHRGLLDTVPAAHESGSRVYWLGIEHVASREFAATDVVDTVIASQALSGAQDSSNGVHVALPGEL